MTHVTFMHKALAALALSGALATPALAQEPGLANCGGIWFSTEEDFFARSGAPGGSIISDGDLLTFDAQARFHVFDHAQVGRAEIDSEHDLAGDHVARVRVDIDVARRPNRMRRMGPGNLVDLF